MSKIVSYNNKTYHINGMGPELTALHKQMKGLGVEVVEYEFAKRNINFFNAKHFHNGDDIIAQTRSWLDDKKQPTEGQVRQALIWSYDSYGDYKIKSGGGSQADNIFISSLKTEIAHPKTGYDTEVVILKKYSTSFNDVLITVKEIEALLNLSATPRQKEFIKKREMEGLFHGLFLHQRERKIKCAKTGKRVLIPAHLAEKFYSQLLSDYPREWVKAEIEKYYRRQEHVKQYRDDPCPHVQVVLKNLEERMVKQEAEREGIEKAWNRGNAYSMQQMRLQQAMEERELLGGFTREEWENEI